VVADVGGGAARPVVLGLVSRHGDGLLDVTVIGELGGNEVLRRSASLAFARGRVVELRLDLRRRCLGTTCAVDETCGDDGCRPAAVAPVELVDWSGSVDANDASEDEDAGTEPGDAATPIDAIAPTDDAPGSECSTAAECDDGWTCTEDRCDAGRCAHIGRDAACDDGIACTSDRCDVDQGCLYVAIDSLCDDGVTCTHDVCDRLMGCRSAPMTATCSAGSYCDPSADCVAAPRFTDIYGAIISMRCGPCHLTTSPRAGNLDMGTEALARASLIGVVATCGGGVNTRVIRGDATHSLLWRKVAGVDLCGARMPRLLTPLADAQIADIQHWIEAGAP
jgi:hypothetical protein